MTKDQLIAILAQFDAAEGGLKKMIAEINAEPLMVAVIEKAVPGVMPVIVILQKVGPYLPLLDQVETAVKAALAAT